MQNYYAILDVEATASIEEIKDAIHRKLRVWSNRTNAPQMERRQEAERMVKDLEEAESILLDASKRSQYDSELKSQPQKQAAAEAVELEEGEDLVAQGWNLLIEGNVADALFVANKATEENGNNSEAWALSAQAKYRWGETEDAIYEYKRAIQLKPNESAYYFDLGSVYESVERWDDALKQYERASNIDPSSTMYRAAIGVLFLKNDKFDEAIQILEACRKEEPENKTYEWFLAIAYSETGYRGWTYVPEEAPIPSGWYATSKEHIDTAKAMMEKALALKFDDNELREDIENQKRDIERNLKRKFSPPLRWLGMIAAAIYIVVGVGMLGDGEFLPFLWFAGGGVLFFVGSMTPQYILNRDEIKVLQYGSKLEKAMDIARGFGEAQAGWMLIIGVALALPIIGGYKVYKNYVAA
ncbi:MAG: tetratricopeptide repeat protein [Candidatus Thiodiazotropha sp. (ex Ctena orbiculata)]|nr:tetratricopeptide repeat protein [Candidatus Thiodiazotropha taylori]